jgi:hypothetical protein
MNRVLGVFAALLLSPALASGQPAQPQSGQGATAPPAEGPPKVPKELSERSDFSLTLTTLDALHKKGAITDEEYNAALRDMIAVGTRATGAPTFVLARFVTTFYGWLQGDFIHDTQRVVTDQWGGHPTLNLANAASGAGVNGRTVFGARGTRLGFRISAPAVGGIRASGNVEFDFLGNQPGVTGTAPRNVATPTTENLTEQSFFTNATPRIRQAFVKLDTPALSVWVGQTWSLIGFEAAYFPTSVQYQGLPGQLFSRNPQLRLSRIFPAGATSVEVAVAMLRPPQIDSEIPDFQGGVKLNVDGWKGTQTLGATGTTVSPASIAISGALRRYKFADSLAVNPRFAFVTGKIIAGDAWIPLLPAKERGPLSIGLLAEATLGAGASDLFTGLTGGATIGQPPGLPANANPLPIQNGDNGLAGWNTTTGKLDTVNWRTLLVGLEIHTGPFVLAGNYSNVYSDNVEQFTGGTGAATGSTSSWNHNMWWNVAGFWDVAPGFRVGAEFARAQQRRVTGQLGTDSRVFVSGFFIF